MPGGELSAYASSTQTPKFRSRMALHPPQQQRTARTRESARSGRHSGSQESGAQHKNPTQTRRRPVIEPMTKRDCKHPKTKSTHPCEVIPVLPTRHAVGDYCDAMRKAGPGDPTRASGGHRSTSLAQNRPSRSRWWQRRMQTQSFRRGQERESSD
ncbi:hypothetical protein K438DRAFT_1761187 [Mycena galopus ATCC 62051]|nr:hypothetical protein K438DRAFT_1761187 [Mycena galopus ATCC 62051]